MLFWIICAALAIIVAATVVMPMVRATDPLDAAPDIAFYKAQLAEVDRDVSREVLAADEAERAKAEIARRLDVRVGVVKKRVFRGKRKLADFLREEVWRYATSAADYEAELRQFLPMSSERKIKPCSPTSINALGPTMLIPFKWRRSLLSR